MTKTIKIPAFPTRQNIIDHINTVIRPEPGQMRALQPLLLEAGRSILADSPADPLDNLVNAMIHDGATPTVKDFADATLAAEQHATAMRAVARLDDARLRINMTINNYPTSEQNGLILEYLSTVLDQIVATARALPDNAPTTADEAIVYGTQGVELLNTMRQLVATYTEVRTQQRKASQIPHNDYNASGHFKDATNSETHWLQARLANAEKHRVQFDRQHLPGLADARTYFEGAPSTPWSPIRAGAYPSNAKNTEDQARFILWVARNTEPWVPSDSDLAEQHLANSELVRLSTWIQPESRRHVSDTDVRDALASVRNQVSVDA
ncbi:hypothetical protein ACFWQK_09070 [Brachybacterium paraconglomeratum]